MLSISSFIKLSSRDKLVAFESLFWVIFIRIIIWIFPFLFVQKIVQKIAIYLANDINTVSMKRIMIMILIASRYVPRATCLVQALAGYILFSKYGYTTSIKIGVLNEKGEFEAHAWLEHEGGVVLGESEKDYNTILEINGGT
jgi:hypothetical protein